ncbi:MAG: cytochrome c3 family protein [Planctomycetota bacterium]|jgi:hypothetical protein
MSESETPRGPVFPPWFDRAVKLGGGVLAGGLVYFVLVGAYAVSPSTISVGYAPEQPVAYSHAVHAGELGMDCRYCHNTVEEAGHAAIPPTQTCMNCHSMIRRESEKLFAVRESNNSGKAIPWVRVHDLADYVYFNHSAHVARGVGCVSCHGRVDKMDVVRQVETLSMGWCLDCHRDPEPHLRPKDQVTVMDWVPEEDQETLGTRLAKEYGIAPSTDCSTCHR